MSLLSVCSVCDIVTSIYECCDIGNGVCCLSKVLGPGFLPGHDILRFLEGARLLSGLLYFNDLFRFYVELNSLNIFFLLLWRIVPAIYMTLAIATPQENHSLTHSLFIFFILFSNTYGKD